MDVTRTISDRLMAIIVKFSHHHVFNFPAEGVHFKFCNSGRADKLE